MSAVSHSAVPLSVCLSVCPSVPCVSTGLVQTTRGHRGSLRCIRSAQEAGSICCDLFPPRVTQPLAPLQEHRTLLLKQSLEGPEEGETSQQVRAGEGL